MGLKLCPKYAFYVLALLWFYPHNSWSFFTSIEPYEEQCYHETVKKGQVWGFLYEVSEGGFLDIDAKLTAPDSRVLYTQEKKTDDSYFFTADQDGRYIFCLANQKSSLVPKLVYFMFDFLNDEKRYNEEDNNNNKTVNVHTNNIVSWWSFFEFALIIGMALGQVYYIRRFFEVKRVI